MRRLAYMAACGVVLAGPAMAGESMFQPNWDCDRPVAELSPVQIERCKEQFAAAKRLMQLVYPEGEQNNQGVRVIRGHR